MTIAPSQTADEVRIRRDPRERLKLLFDPGTQRPLGPDDDGEVVAARGLVDGVEAVAFATDATRMGGALGAGGCDRIVATIEAAIEEALPVVGIWHSGGAKLPEGVRALDGMGRVFAAVIRASGRVPQISLVLGPSAGGAAYGPALTDVVVMSDEARMFVTGPDVIRAVTGEQVDMLSLGGPEVHGRYSGVAHVVARDEADAFESTRRTVGLLGARGRSTPAVLTEHRDLARFLPERPTTAYDVRPMVAALLDAPGVELHARWARNVVTTLGRFAGGTVGVVANNPIRAGGCLDSAAADKAARFVRMCDALGVPLIVLVDVPGYLPGVGQERDGVIRRGAKLLHAFAEATVPRVTVVSRKAYGGAYIAMNSRSLGATAVFAWPNAEVAVMGAGPAVDILHRRRLAAAAPEERDELRRLLVQQQAEAAGGVARAREIGVVDDIIAPSDTRHRIAGVLSGVPASRGWHTNIPL